MKTTEFKSLIRECVEELIKEGNLDESRWIQKAVHPSRKGMFKSKNQSSLKTQLANVKKKTQSYKDRGQKVPHELRKKISQLVFAIRAKSKKGLA